MVCFVISSLVGPSPPVITTISTLLGRGLTTDTEEQAMARVGGAHGHKGKDAVDAAMEMVSIIRQLEV